MILFIEDRKESIDIHMGNNEIRRVKQHCKIFLDQLCKRYGSTYEGRRKAACAFLHIRQKAPILITKGMMLFPSLSADVYGCVWINYCEIYKIEAAAIQTKIIFQNRSEVIIDMEYRSALLQLRRCAHYLYALNMHMDLDQI